MRAKRAGLTAYWMLAVHSRCRLVQKLGKQSTQEKYRHQTAIKEQIKIDQRMRHETQEIARQSITEAMNISAKRITQPRIMLKRRKRTGYEFRWIQDRSEDIQPTAWLAAGIIRIKPKTSLSHSAKTRLRWIKAIDTEPRKAETKIKAMRCNVSPINLKHFMALRGKKALESFIDCIESDSCKRKHWLSRVREAGFDQALSEFRRTVNAETVKWQIWQLLRINRPCPHKMSHACSKITKSRST